MESDEKEMINLQLSLDWQILLFVNQAFILPQSRKVDIEFREHS